MKRILDPCCGSKMFWFDPHNPDVEFCDIRRVEREKIWESKDGKEARYLTVDPDTIADVRHLPFPDNSFWHIVFDPPHLTKIGRNAWLYKKYGKLPPDWGGVDAGCDHGAFSCAEAERDADLQMGGTGYTLEGFAGCHSVQTVVRT